MAGIIFLSIVFLCSPWLRLVCATRIASHFGFGGFLIASAGGWLENFRVALVSKPVFQVQVRELVEFALWQGDLGGERDFVGSRRALARIRGHQKLQRSRPAGYEKEVAVAHEIDAEEFTLRVRGRIDGVLAEAGGVRVEEIKTVQRGWDGQADPLHWGQAKCYGFIYAHDHGLPRVQLRLTYLDLDSGGVTEFDEVCTADELAAFFQKAAEVYIDWLRAHYRRCRQRDESIRALVFPFASYRQGQRELAVAAYRTLARGGRLFLEAPTGIGKTMSVVFPAIKALGEGKIERIFYLTARTVVRAVAEKAFLDLQRGGVRLRTLTLTAKEKICVQGGQPCDPRTCPLARGYYDRRLGAMRAALEEPAITRPILEAVSHKQQVCPFELSLDLSSWVDAVICDYNYVFDPQVYLRRHFAEETRDYAFLVDEAHNLVDRAREMFSAELNTGEIQAVRRTLGSGVSRCKKALGKLVAILRGFGEADGPVEEAGPGGELELFAAGVPAPPEDRESPARSERRRREARAPDGPGARVSRAIPEGLPPVLEQALGETEAWLARNEPAEFRESLLALFFQLHAFWRTAQLYDERYVTIVDGPGRAENGSPGRTPQRAAAAVRIRLFCLDPSFLLREALSRGKAAVFFSATLSPMDYYRELLGGSPEDRQLQLPSPFPPENLAVLVQDRIRTQFKARAETLAEVARAIGVLVEGKPGNYLVYLPSYAYLKSVQEEFQAQYPDVPLLAQRPGMTEPERESFLNAFGLDPKSNPAASDPDADLDALSGPALSLAPGTNREDDQSRAGEPQAKPPTAPPAAGSNGTLVGFAVLGGVFGEGIDLVGERLIGAMIVGVGLPQLCLERDLIRDYFQEKTGQGFNYAYTFPGMNRVLQAIGRVIRTETDRGVVLLIDTRFGENRYRQLFPAWWRPAHVRTLENLRLATARFWNSF